MGGGSSITRRGFLLASACTAAGGTARAASKEAWFGVRRGNCLRVGVIGCGAQGLRHLAALRRFIGEGHAVEIAGVSDAHPARLAQARRMSGAEAFADWEALLDGSDIDAVIVATPDHWHLPMARAAIERGKAVYLEPPLALEWPELRALREKYPDAGRLVHVSLSACGDPRWKVAADAIRQGRLGRIRWSQTALPSQICEAEPTEVEEEEAGQVDWRRFYGPVAAAECHPSHFSAWRNYQAFSNGVVSDLHFSCLAPLLTAARDTYPACVSAAGGVFAGNGRDTPDAFTATITYSSGHTAVLVAGAPGVSSGRQVVRGEQGTLEFRGGDVIFAPEGGTPRVLASEASMERMAGDADLTQWIVQLQRGEEASDSFEMACRVQAAVCMAAQAYRTGRTVSFDAFC